MYWLLLFFVFLILNQLIKRGVKQKKQGGEPNSILKVQTLSERKDLTLHIPNDSLHGHRCFVDTKLHEYELTVVKKLAKHLNPSNYYIFNNVIIPSSVTITSQVDHIVVSKFGIFIIENKDLKGWIFGNRNWSTWTQSFSAKDKFKFQNPILQNYAHSCALKEQLPFINIKALHNVVVFSEESEFKTQMPENVIQGKELINYILSKNKVLINEGELLMAIGKISMLCQNNQIPLSEHINNIKERMR